MAINGSIFTMETPNTEKSSELLSQLGSLLGVGTRDDGRFYLSDMCQSKRVNKASKIKPIRHPKEVNLTVSDFKGTTADNNRGVYYGIVFPAAASANLNQGISAIHDATYEYEQPRGVNGAEYVEYNRIRDFNGYDHNAKFNPSAYFNKQSDGTLIGYYDDMGGSVGGLQNITVYYLETNETGVNLLEIYGDLGSSFDSETLGKTYPCILVSNEAGTINYFTALDYTDDSGNTAPRPIKKDGEVSLPSRWSVRFTKPLSSPNGVGDTERPPFSSYTEGLRVSIFLLKSINAYHPLLSGDVLTGVNFGTHWIDIADGLAASSRAISVPDDNGVPLTLRRLGLYSYYTATLTQNGESFTMTLNFYNPQGEATGKTAKVNATLMSAESGRSVSFSPTLITPNSLSRVITMSSFDIMYIPGAEVELVMTVTTEIDGETATWSDSVTIVLE